MFNSVNASEEKGAGEYNFSPFNSEIKILKVFLMKLIKLFRNSTSNPRNENIFSEPQYLPF